MNAQEQPKQDRSTHLLDAIKAIWAKVGGAMNDYELTRFLEKTELPTEAEFSFLSFSEGRVILNVPKQNPADWYSQNGDIALEKEKIAKEIAKKHQFLLFEPIDSPSNIYSGSFQVIHRHLTLTDRRQTVVVAHPLFLKICLLGKPLDHLYGPDPRFPLPLGPDLLREISPLYT